MAYLDIGPVLIALREQPTEFELRGAKLRHVPSRHQFGFTGKGRAVISRTRCDCAQLTISSRQSAALRAAIDDWAAVYWQPLQAHRAEVRRVARINRDFARHFRPGLHRLLDRIRALWHRVEPDHATTG